MGSAEQTRRGRIHPLKLRQGNGLARSAELRLVNSADKKLRFIVHVCMLMSEDFLNFSGTLRIYQDRGPNTCLRTRTKKAALSSETLQPLAFTPFRYTLSYLMLRYSKPTCIFCQRFLDFFFHLISELGKHFFKCTVDLLKQYFGLFAFFF